MLDELDILGWLDSTEPVYSTIPEKSSNIDTLTSSDVAGMCCEIKREVLLSLLEKAMPVVPTRDIIPVLTNLEFRLSEEELIITASATDKSVRVLTSQVITKQPGKQLIPARMLYSIIREAAPESLVYLEATVHGLVVVAGAYTSEIALPKSSSGFPELEPLEGVRFHEVDRSAFINAISTVKYALPGKDFFGQDSLRMVSIKGGKFTAFDGARFQQVRIPGFELRMQLPTADIAVLLKVLSFFDAEMLDVGEISKKLIFRVGNVVFYLNKLETPYPNVEQLWLRPALTNDQEFIVDKQELITAIKQVRVTADSTSNAVGLIMDENSVKIVAKDSNNSSSTTIKCSWSGKPRTVVVNYMHLAEMLKSYAPKECKFLLGEDTRTYKSPILLKDDDTMAIATIGQMPAYRAGLT